MKSFWFQDKVIYLKDLVLILHQNGNKWETNENIKSSKDTQ